MTTTRTARTPKSFALWLMGAALLCAQEPQTFDVLVPAPAPPAPSAPAIVGQAAFAGSARTFMFVAGEILGGGTVKGAPYSAEAVTETTQTLADGNRIVNRSSALIYRDSEGRERREQSLPNIGPFVPQTTGSGASEPPKTVFISDPVAQVNYTLNPFDHTAIRLPVPPVPPVPPSAGSMAYPAAGVGLSSAPPPPPPGIPQPEMNVIIQRIDRPGAPEAGTSEVRPQMVYIGKGGPSSLDAPHTEQLGSKLIEGVQATGIRTTITIPAGQMGNEKPIEIVDERWYSDELKITVLSEHNDPRTGRTLYSLKNVSRAEPDPALFRVPADYKMSEPPLNIQKFERRIGQ
jgi:hypothetical protein